MKILIVSSEVEPFSKTGGLADVAGALPKELKEAGHDIRVVTPKYQMTDKGNFKSVKIGEDIEISVGTKKVKAQFFETRIPGSEVKVYLIGCDQYFNRPNLYQENGRDYPDNCERFIFFCKAVLALLKMLAWGPHVIHCNDWQSALIPAYIKTIYKNDNFYSGIATVYTIHNMGYLGLFNADKMPLTGLGWENFTPDTLEFWGNLCFAKAGLIFSDIISTVSPTYAKEIQTEEFGCGLDGLIRARSSDVFGIINGIDYGIWDPEKDKELAKKYGVGDSKGKAKNKNALRKTFSLKQKRDHALIGMVTRMTDQKGFDILTKAFDDIMKLNVQFVLLGTGDPKYEKQYKDFSLKYPDKVSVNIGFDSAVAPQIYAGCDMFLMPSKYEPCGLGQLISFKYGAVPVVRKTGGLADTVIDFDEDSKNGNGFVFSDYASAPLYNAVKRAVNIFNNEKILWEELFERIMKYDYSWKSSSMHYLDLYKEAVKRVSERL